MTPDPQYPAIYHLGFVVPDFDASREINGAFLGDLDFYRRFTLEVDDVSYRGTTVSYSAEIAFYDSRNIRIELIQPIGEGPSPYHDHLAAHGGRPSVHHVAYLVESIDEHLTRATGRGSSPRLILEAPLPAGNGRYAYYDGLLDGVVVEFLERHS
ncbi:VOC family protein [Agromyces sp. Marseille-P2726]|uniref:VOC family protein n=1 Tax=Agromyces sp. Marseille-P2726 TaxID=2709132 RepID=UPI00156E95FF|nr:VOC family protein [Agromyces sp. Marseille-P2726]